MTSYGLNMPGSGQQQQSSPNIYSSATVTDRPAFYSTSAPYGTTSTFSSGATPTRTAVAPVTYNVDPRLPAYSPPQNTGMVLPSLDNNRFTQYNTVLTASDYANRMSSLPYAGSMFNALGGVGQQIASGMSF